MLNLIKRILSRKGNSADDFPTGLFGELCEQDLPGNHGYYFIPSLLSVLIAAKEKKKAPLTDNEILSLRDKLPSIILPDPLIEELNKGRTYRDIDAIDCIAEWRNYEAEV